MPGISAATVQYTVTPDPGTSSLSVSVRIDHPRPVETFSIPGWSPGFYVMQHFERRIGIVGAHQGAGSDKVSRVGARSWTVRTRGSQPLTFSYRVQGNDVGLGFFGTYVRDSEAYYNGPSAYMYVAGRRNEACTLLVKVAKGWGVATAMDPVGPNKWAASNYDVLADYPVQMGKFDVRRFSENGIPYEAIFVWPDHSVRNFDIDAQMKVISAVSLPAIKLYGGASFKRYLYIFHLTGIGFQGGLEHRAGTVIAVPNTDGDDISDLVAHEEFHAWNVKQIRPRLLGPFNYTAPQRTGALWFAEGVTDYYAKMLTYRSGVHDKDWLYEQLSEQVATLQIGETRKTNTVEDASRQVWEHNGFDLGDLSYYNKGLLAGWIFDVDLRRATHGARSLDDVMRLMYKEYKFPHAGYDEDGILRAISQVAGQDMTGLYNRMIRSTAEMPYSDLQSIGLDISAMRGSADGAIGVRDDSKATPEEVKLRNGWLSKDGRGDRT